MFAEAVVINIPVVEVSLELLFLVLVLAISRGHRCDLVALYHARDVTRFLVAHFDWKFCFIFVEK